jgi:hypothetical protein
VGGGDEASFLSKMACKIRCFYMKVCAFFLRISEIACCSLSFNSSIFRAFTSK